MITKQAPKKSFFGVYTEKARILKKFFFQIFPNEYWESYRFKNVDFFNFEVLTFWIYTLLMTNTKHLEVLNQLTMLFLLIYILFWVLSLKAKPLAESSVLYSSSCVILLCNVENSHLRTNLAAFHSLSLSQVSITGLLFWITQNGLTLV